jgi:hypothetical protein
MLEYLAFEGNFTPYFPVGNTEIWYMRAPCTTEIWHDKWRTKFILTELKQDNSFLLASAKMSNGATTLYQYCNTPAEATTHSHIPADDIGLVSEGPLHESVEHPTSSTSPTRTGATMQSAKL